MVFQVVVFHTRTPPLFIAYQLVRIPGSTSIPGVSDPMRLKSLILLTLMLTAPMASARIIYVDANAAGLGNGGSWANAYTDLQTAIEYSASGDSIYIANGSYTAQWGIFMHIKSGLSVYGGFAGESNPQQRAGIYTALPTPGTVLIGRVDVTGNNARLDGLYIYGPKSWVSVNGAGVTIANCRIVNTGPGWACVSGNPIS